MTRLDRVIKALDDYDKLVEELIASDNKDSDNKVVKANLSSIRNDVSELILPASPNLAL